MNSRRLAGLLVGTGLLVATALPAESATASTGVVAGFELVRTSSGPTSFDFFVSATTPADGSFIGEIDATVHHARVSSVTPGGFTSQGRPADGATVVGQPVSTCGALGCGGALQGIVFEDISYSSATSRGDVNLIFVVAEGGKVSYRFHSQGWRLHRTTLRHHIVELASAGPVSARMSGYGAAVFTGATASGGAHGSVAEAVPPCSTSTIGAVSRGVGTIALNGGTSSPSSLCPVDTMPLAAFSPGATTWSATGDVVGDSTLVECPLFTIDLPPIPHVSD